MSAVDRIFSAPAPHRDNLSKLADFAELCALRERDGEVSQVDLIRRIAKAGDDDSDGSGVQSGAKIEAIVEEVFQELELRGKHCGKERYPFLLSETGTRTKCVKRLRKHYFYLFLLLSTRLNMGTNRTHANIDGTQLFEQLSKEVLMRFLGYPDKRVRGIVHGKGRYNDDEDEDSPAKQTFSLAITKLCDEIKEGIGFTQRNDFNPKKKDDKLDIVAWREFSDLRFGRLIFFGQCKTGSNWKHDLGKLQPEGFISKWFIQNVAVPPVRSYFVSDRVCSDWYENSVDGGVFFDRCRIIDYCDQIQKVTLDRIVAWTEAALKSINLS